MPLVLHFYGENAGGCNDDQIVFDIQIVIFQPQVLQTQNSASEQRHGFCGAVFSFLSEFQAPAGVLDGARLLLK